MSFARLSKELKDVRITWKKEAGNRQGANKPQGVSFVDGIVFGLTLAIDIVERYRKELVRSHPRGHCICP